MSIVAFAGDIKVTALDRGVLLTKKGESWGDPWPVQDETITVTDVDSLIQALRSVQQEKSYDTW
jgi:hypothetical protein